MPIWLTALRDSADTIPFPSKLNMIFRSLWTYIPMSILYYVKYIPTREHTRLRRTLNTINEFAKELIAEKTEAILAGKGENKKDIMSILGALCFERVSLRGC